MIISPSALRARAGLRAFAWACRPSVRRSLVSEHDGPDDLPAVGHAQALEKRTGIPVQAEEESSQPLSGGGEQEQHDGEGGVHEPVRHRPAGGRQPCEARVGLVGFAIPRDVGARISEGHHDHRRFEQARERPRVGDEGRIARELEELPRLRGSLQHKEIDSLGEARGRPVGCDFEHSVEDLGGHCIGGVAADHPASSHDLVELHGAEANGQRRSRRNARGRVPALGKLGMLS